MIDEPTLPDDPLNIRKNETAGIGHNNPPAFDLDAFEVTAQRIDRFLETSDKWVPVEINDDDIASKLNDQIAGLRKLHKDVDGQRKAEKKPHDDRGKAVQDAFLPQLERIKKAASKLTPKLDRFTREKEEKIKAEAARKRAEAEAAAAEAQRIADEAAASGSIDAELEAERAAKEAEKASKEADRASKQKANVASASGGGRTHSVRKTKTAEITNIRRLFLYYQDRPEVVDLLQRLANADVRRADFDGTPPPGTKVVIQ